MSSQLNYKVHEKRDIFLFFFFSFSIFKKVKARENETNMKSIKSNHILGRVSRKTGIQRKEILVWSQIIEKSS